MTLPCPACAAPLAPFSPEPGLEVDHCSACKATWFDRGELARLRAAPSDLPHPERARAASPGPLRCPKCADQALLRFLATDAGPEVDHCARCGGTLLDAGELGALKQAARPVRRPRPTAPAKASAEGAPKTSPGASPVASTSTPAAPRAGLDPFALLPLAGLPLGLLMHAAGLGLLLGWFSAWFHELGHSWVAWCAGFKALPLVFAPGLAWSSMSAEPTWVVVVCFGFLNLVSAAVGLGRRQAVPVLIGLTGILGQLYWGALATEREVFEAISWAGIAGELLGPSLVLLASYHALPPRFHWDLARWPLAWVSGACLVGAMALWMQVADDPNLAPWGTGIGGRGDSGGDLNQLRDIHGWTVDDMSGRALRLGWFGLGLVGAQMAWRAVFGGLARPWEGVRARG